MTKIRLYLDEDSMSRALVRALRARGVDVVTALQADMIERSDAHHLDYATQQGRALFSFNVSDFYQIHSDYLAQGTDHSGIVLARQQAYSIGDQTRQLLKLIAAFSAEEMRNRVEFLGAWK